MTKMKKIFIPVLAIMGLFVISSCEDLIKEYTGPWFIHFDKTNVEITEISTDTLEIEVFLSASTQESATTVEFTVSSTSAEKGTDYEVISPSGTTLTFEPGVHKQTIKVRVFDNLDATGNKDIVIDLVSNSAGFILGMPGEGSPKKSCTITIKDDDCPFIVANFPTIINAMETGTWNNYLCTYTFTNGQEISPNVYTFDVKGFFSAQLKDWGETFVEGGTVVVKFDCTNRSTPKVIIEQQKYGKTVDPSGANWEYWIDQSGSGGPSTDYSFCDITFSLPYTIHWKADFSDAGQPELTKCSI